VSDDARKRIAEARRAPDESASDTFGRYIGRLELPGRLSEVGVTNDKFELIGRNAMLSVFTPANPRTIESLEHIVDILIAA
jgi:maleylacetate reductase